MGDETANAMESSRAGRIMRSPLTRGILGGIFGMTIVIAVCAVLWVAAVLYQDHQRLQAVIEFINKSVTASAQPAK